MGVEIYLKGGVATSIDENGIITKNTTWMVLDTEHRNDFLGWLAFEKEVEAWAGTTGMPYKRPVPTPGQAEITTFENDPTFAVTAIDINIVEGRTHYEVSYTQTQNPAILTMTGNVSVEVNNNNEKTKSANYLLSIPFDDEGNPDLQGIDTHLFKSGEVVEWAGENYLIESSSYQAQSSTQYNISVNAKDMSKLMLGNPTFNTDSFGQRTATVNWRLSNVEFDLTTLPQPGEGIGDWFGEIPEKDKYIITEVSSDPDGVLGYTIKLSAKHVSKRVVKVSKDYKWEADNDVSRAATIVYQSDSEHVTDFDDKIGKEASEEGFDGLTVTHVEVSPVGINDYEVTMETSDDKYGNHNFSNNNNEKSLDKEVTINSTLAYYRMNARQCGLFRGASDLAYWPINDPPAMTRQEAITVSKLKEYNSKAWSNSAILSAIHSGQIGFSSISSVQYNGENVVPPNLSSITDVDAIGDINLVSWYYPQPSQRDENTPFGKYFIPWVAKDEVPIMLGGYDVRRWPKNKHKLDMHYNERWIGKAIPYMDCNVTLNYRGSVASVMNKSWKTFFDKAVDKLDNTTLKSYKFNGINFARVMDTTGKEWTQVTVGIKALLEGKWNPYYEDGADL